MEEPFPDGVARETSPHTERYRGGQSQMPCIASESASSDITVAAIPNDLDVWCALISEPRLSENLVTMTISHRPRRTALLRYSAPGGAEAMLYRSAVALNKRYGMVLSQVSASPKESQGRGLPASVERRSLMEEGGLVPCQQATPKIACADAVSRPAETLQNPSTAEDLRELSDDDYVAVSAQPASHDSSPATLQQKNSISAINRVLGSIDQLPDTPVTSQTGPKSSVQARSISALQQRLLLTGIQALSRKSSAIYFAQPMNDRQIKLLKAPNYYEVIKNPMDLRTMEEKLRGGRYGSLDEYVGDFRQIVKNTEAFNGKDHPVTSAAHTLRAIFEEQINKARTISSIQSSRKAEALPTKGRPRKWRKLEAELASSLPRRASARRPAEHTSDEDGEYAPRKLQREIMSDAGRIGEFRVGMESQEY